jgi:hypothetical protein
VREEILPALAGVCAMLGWVFFYHRQYDNQMLFPLMLAAAIAVFRTKNIPHLIFALVLAATLYLPAGVVAKTPTLFAMALYFPVLAAVFILVSQAKTTPARPNSR